jgi:hypothetical protein
MFERHDQKLVVFAFMAIFVSYCPMFWGSGGIYMAHDISTCLRDMTKNLSFLHFWAIFVTYSPQFWVFEVIFKPMTLSTYLTWMTKNSSFLCLWSFLGAIAHCFGVSGDLDGPRHLVHV